MRWSVPLLVVALAATARAEEVPHDPADPADPADAPAAAKKAPVPAVEGDPEKAKDKVKVDVGGRVFVRETFSHAPGGDWVGAAELQSARVSVKVDWKKLLRGEVTLEAAGGQARIRDAWIRIALSHGMWVRGGRFKMPVSAIELESGWTLPLVDRGVVSDIYDDGFELAGRKNGFAFGWEGKGELKPEVEIGAFQAENVSGDTQPGRAEDAFGLTFAARGRITLADALQLALWGSSRLAHDGVNPVPERNYALGVDAELEAGGWRAWGEVAFGSTALDITPETPETPKFMSGRLILAWRHGGVERGDFYVEPYAGGAFVDANLSAASDGVGEGYLGVNAGHWRRWRVQVEGRLRRVGAQRPGRLAGDVALADGEAVIVQLGAAF